jgi:hypothetical protein
MTQPLPRWRGWTLVDERGRIVNDPYNEPFLWKCREDAQEIKEDGQRVVRCELRVVK